MVWNLLKNQMIPAFCSSVYSDELLTQSAPLNHPTKKKISKMSIFSNGTNILSKSSTHPTLLPVAYNTCRGANALYRVRLLGVVFVIYRLIIDKYSLCIANLSIKTSFLDCYSVGSMYFVIV